MAGQLRDILNTENLKKTGFELGLDGTYRHENEFDSNVLLANVGDELRLFLYSNPENPTAANSFVYSIGAEDKGLSTRKIGLSDNQEHEISEEDEEKMMKIIANSSQLQALGLDMSQENENERGFFQKIGDFFARIISEHPVATEIITGVAIAALTLPLSPIGAAVAGGLAGVGVKLAENAAEKRHNNNTLRRRNSLSGSLKAQREGDQNEKSTSKAKETDQKSASQEQENSEPKIPQALSKTQVEAQPTQPTYHSHHAQDVGHKGHDSNKKFTDEISEKHNRESGAKTHLEREMAKRMSSAKQNNGGAAHAA